MKKGSSILPGIETLIVLGTADSSSLVKSHAQEFPELKDLGQEGYILQPVKLNGREVVLGMGDTPDGVKNAAMTLSQMAVEEDGQVSLELSRITDRPDIAWRGVNKMLDYIFPGKLPSKSYVEGITNFQELIDAMMRVKFNTLVVHAANISWRAQKDSVTSWESSAGSYGGPQFWTPKIQDIIKYAHARGIKVVLLLYHTLSGTGKITVPGRDICLNDPGNEKLLMEEFRSYVKAFPDLDGYVIHSSEFERCTCPTCQRTPPWEEFLRYFNGYHQILREHSQTTILAYVALAEGYSWVSKEHKDQLPKGARNFIWADFFNYYLARTGKWEPKCDMGRTTFLLPVSESIEGREHWFDDLPGRTWYWLYVNGLADLRLPFPDFLKSRALASTIKNVESVQGEFGYQRGADLNTLALAAFTWNSGDDAGRFRKAASARLYGLENSSVMLPIETAYEKLVHDYVAMIGMVDSNWRWPSTWWLDNELERVVAGCDELTARLGSVRTSTPLVAERLKGFQDDLAILKQEALIRQKLREAYLDYEVYAPQVYGIRGTETAENTRKSLRRAKEALEFHQALAQMREERATPLRPVKDHQEVLQKLVSSLEKAAQTVELNRDPIRPDWGSVQSSFWFRTWTW